MKITVTKAEGEKCARCWRIVPALSIESGYEDVCERCVIAVLSNKLSTLISGAKELLKEDTTETRRKCENALIIAEGKPDE